MFRQRPQPYKTKFLGNTIKLDFKSNKSKRVATSTFHAEALACIFGLESTTFVQTFLLELARPDIATLDLLEPQEGVVPIVVVTDCNDLHSVLVAPAQTTLASKHLSLYVAAIREFKALNRVKSFVWIDTRDMAANSMTKLGKDQTVDSTEILPLLRTFSWTPRQPLTWQTQLCQSA